MTKQCYMVFVVFVSLAAFQSNSADAQWGQSNRGWGGRSNGWGGQSNGWGGRNNGWGGRSNQNNGLGQFLGGLGKVIDGATQGMNQGPMYDEFQNEIHRPPNGGRILEGLIDMGTSGLNNNSDPYYPRRRVYPQYVQPRTVYTPKTEVKSNDLPAAEPEPKKKEVTAVDPNSFSLDGSTITAADIHNTTEDAKDHIDSQTDDIREDMMDKLEKDVDSLPEPPYTKADKEAIKDKLKDGKSVDGLIKGGSDTENLLRDADDAFKTLDDIAEDAKDGRLDPRDLDDFEKDFGGMFDSTADLTHDLDKIGADSFWINLLDKANPSIGGLPLGMDTQIIYVPDMPSGQIVSLGNGTVLVGTGGATSGVVLMTGNAAQVAGLSVGIGPPVPDSDVEEMLNGVLLLNEGDKEVHYNVNSDQFSMPPDYTQALPGDDIWAVEFDRGGTHGKTKYGISNGTYAFTPTDTGWELYEQPESKVTIDNTDNEFPFNYVINNTQQTVAAGEANEHSHKYPMVIRFDDGTGQERRKALDKEKYTLAVTAEGTMDLFEPSYVEPPIKIEQVAKAPVVNGRSLLKLDGKRSGGLFSGGSRSSSTKKRGLLNFNN